MIKVINMPTQKKKLKKAKSSEKLKIKDEPFDIKPLGEYVDDRVELIKQAFMVVKSKRIKSLLPDFLQVSQNETRKISKT